MIEILKAEIPIHHNPSRLGLPTRRANILHALGYNKNINYYLDPYYKGIKITPDILYRLQSNQIGFNRGFGVPNKSLKIIDGKIIMTDLETIDKNTRFVIKSGINNPIETSNLQEIPDYRQYLKYSGKDFFLLSFIKQNTKDNNHQEDLLLISYEDKKGLKAKKLSHIENMPDRKIGFENINGTPLLKISNCNSKIPNGISRNTLDLENLKIGDKKGFNDHDLNKHERTKLINKA